MSEITIIGQIAKDWGPAAATLIAIYLFLKDRAAEREAQEKVRQSFLATINKMSEELTKAIAKLTLRVEHCPENEESRNGRKEVHL